MAQHFEGDTKKFTLTAFLSFATVFCVVMLFMRCHGDYKPGGGAHGAASEHKSEAHGTSHGTGDAHSGGATHDSTATHHGDSTTHSTEHKDTSHANGAHH